MGHKIEHSDKEDIENIYLTSKNKVLGLRDVIIASLKSKTFMENSFSDSLKVTESRSLKIVPIPLP